MNGTTPTAAVAPAQLPRIVPLIGAAGLALVANRFAPGPLVAVIGLVVAYVALTNVPRVLDLVNTAPAGLRSAYQAAPGHAGGGRKP